VLGELFLKNFEKISKVGSQFPYVQNVGKHFVGTKSLFFQIFEHFTKIMKRLKEAL
jgi:hypothetical protein